MQRSIADITDQLYSAVRERRAAETAKLVALIPHAPLEPLGPAATARLSDAAARASSLAPAVLTHLPSILARCSAFALPDLSLVDVMRFDLARGIFKTNQGQYLEAVDSLESALALSLRADDTDVQAVARYHLSRCCRKAGKIRDAEDHAATSLQLDLEAGNLQRAGVTQCLLGWLHFMMRDVEQALALLNMASATLESTDDHLSKADILAFKGRVLRRGGRYDEAADSFEKAIDVYKRADPRHRNLARARMNYSFTLLMKSRRFQDSRSLKEFALLLEAAEKQLACAEEIYRANNFKRGLASVQNLRASLAFERCNFTLAQEYAGAAARIGEGHPGIAAQAMVIATMAECAQEDNADREQALTFAERARHYASQQPDNGRTDARARIATGMALLLPPTPPQARKDASKLCSEAGSLLTDWDQDYVRGELNELGQAVSEQRDNGDEVIYQIRASDLAGRSLENDILPQIADAILLAAYERNGRRVSRTARALKCGSLRVRKALPQEGRLKTASR